LSEKISGDDSTGQISNLLVNQNYDRSSASDVLANNNDINNLPLQKVQQRQSKPRGTPGTYSLLNLPIKTLNLLTAQADFENDLPEQSGSTHLTSSSSTTNNNKIDSTTSSNSKSIKSQLHLREVQVYISTPDKSDEDPSRCLFTKRHNTISNQSIFQRLEANYQNNINDCDINFIDFNNDNSNMTNDPNLLNNKYYRRLLTKTILKDLLNNNNDTNGNGYCLYVVEFFYLL
jgi:hypothetical protein